eukprot:8960491-Alexandrium_andersonii.AAC.1
MAEEILVGILLALLVAVAGSEERYSSDQATATRKARRTRTTAESARTGEARIFADHRGWMGLPARAPKKN